MVPRNAIPTNPVPTIGVFSTTTSYVRRGVNTIHSIVGQYVYVCKQ